MTDIFHYVGNDTQFAANGDDLIVDGATEMEQRIFRGLITAPGDDPFNPKYGVAIGSFVGQALTPEKFAELKAGILSVVLTEPDVQKIPAPNIAYNAVQNNFLSATIQYVYSPTGQIKSITAP